MCLAMINSGLGLTKAAMGLSSPPPRQSLATPTPWLLSSRERNTGPAGRFRWPYLSLSLARLPLPVRAIGWPQLNVAVTDSNPRVAETVSLGSL
jgi:hypothetical protein